MKRLNFSKKTGFTLAEVLVTLGIIGVVAALTIPTLVNNNQRAVMTTQLRKITTELNLAFTKYLSDQRVESLRESQLAGNTTGLSSFFANYIKTAKNCYQSFTPCFADTYYTIDGSKTLSLSSKSCNAVYTLKSGAAICADVADIKAESDTPTNNAIHITGDGVVNLIIDVNGTAGPNVIARDIFEVQVTTNGDINDYYSSNYSSSNIVSQNALTNGAFGKIVEDGWQMTY